MENKPCFWGASASIQTTLFRVTFQNRENRKNIRDDFSTYNSLCLDVIKKWTKIFIGIILLFYCFIYYYYLFLFFLIMIFEYSCHDREWVLKEVLCIHAGDN